MQNKQLFADKVSERNPPVILVNLDPTIGSEIKKAKSCVVISPKEMNRYLQTIVIAPMTTSSKSYPIRVEIKRENKIGWIVLDQIQTTDKQRIIKDMGKLSKTLRSLSIR